ncbi:MAG: hypothetical protein ACYCW6_17230, partial [Candidatus Xenobia bacterium]
MALLDRLIDDTAKSARAVHARLLRERPASDRIKQAAALTRMVRTVSLQGVQRRNPGISPAAARLAVLRIIYGKQLIQG